MPSVQEIRELIVSAKSQGLDKVESDLNAVSSAQNSVAASGQTMASVTDIVTKRQLSASSAYERLARSIDVQYRSQQELVRGQQVLDRALAQGAITAGEYARQMANLNARWGSGNIAAPITAAGQATKLASHEVTNLSAQLQDITVSLAGGQSPFTVMLQQGSQISGLMGDRGLKTIISGVGQALLSLVNPTTAVLAGFTALYVGGAYAYEALIGSSKTLDDQLKAQEALIKQVRAAYDEATGAATKWQGASQAASTVRVTATLKELNDELAKASAAFLKASATFTLDPNDVIGKDIFGGAKAEFAAFSDVIGKFYAGVKDPAAWQALEDGIGRVADANPALTESGKKLLDLMENGLKAATGVETLDSALRALRGTAEVTDLTKIGIDKLKKDAEEAAKVIAKLEADIALVGNDRQKAVNDALSKLGPGAGFDAVASVASAAGRKYDKEEAAKDAEKRAREAQSEAKRASQDLARDADRWWDETRTAAEKYAETLDELNGLVAKGAINQDTYARAVAKASQELEKQRLEETKKALEKSGSAADGFTLGVMRYQEQIGSMAKQTSDLTVSMFGSMENALEEFVKTGKLNFTDLINSMIADLAKFYARQVMYGLVGMFGAPGMGGSGGSFVPTYGAAGPYAVPTLHSGGIAGTDATAYRMDHPALYANAPRYHSGRDPYGLLNGERRAIIKDDEGVFTRAQMRALGLQAQAANRNAAGPNGNGGVYVNVHNNGPGQARVQERRVGGKRYLDVIVEEKVNKAVVKGHLDSTMRNRFDTTPRLVEKG